MVGVVRLVRRSGPAVALLALAALLLPAPTAMARIAPQRGIAGIYLQMTRAQVVQRKGRPDAERVIRSEILGRQRMVRYGQTRAFFGGVRRDAGVVSVTTKSRRQRTRSGVGVGSSEAAVQNGVPGVTCRAEFGVRHCWKGEFTPGKRVTDFRIDPSGGRVTEVVVGFVID